MRDELPFPGKNRPIVSKQNSRTKAQGVKLSPTVTSMSGQAAAAAVTTAAVTSTTTTAGDASATKRASSLSRSRPTTPLRPSSRSSFRESARRSVSGDAAAFPLNAFEPAFSELSDAMADLEANMMHFQLMHESLSRFGESFASFLYGLNMNAFCVDFPEVYPFLPSLPTMPFIRPGKCLGGAKNAWS
jgi:hypothetical protein